jgi:predicted O-linked N-acetylglucosamine transferase (SPINDLY family)
MMPDVIDQTLAAALQVHQSGRLAEAGALYREVLEKRPRDPSALHLLGLVTHQQGDHAGAAALIRRAIAIAPAAADFYKNLGVVLTAGEKFEEAIESYRHALAMRPNDPEAHFNLAIVFARVNRHAEAIAACRAALGLKPDYIAALNLLGISLAATDELDAAETAYDRSLSINADQREVWVQRAALCIRKRDLKAALTVYQSALRRLPGSAELLTNCGNVLKGLGFLSEAIDVYRKALLLLPSSTLVMLNLGAALAEAGQKAEALALLRRAAAAEPGSSDVRARLGILLLDLGKPQEALAESQAALDLQPKVDARYIDVGKSLFALDRYDEAAELYRRLIEISPRSVEAYHNLGLAQLFLARPEEAMKTLRQAQSIDPDNERVSSNLVLASLYHPGIDSAGTRHLLAEWEDRHAKRYRESILPHQNHRDPNRRLRIGYVSADLRGHVVGRNILPLLREHDRAQFEIFCYANNPYSDAVTQRLKTYVDEWRDIRVLTDRSAVDLVREDRIDILVDLALHTSHHRLLVFARKPAPVQMCFAGYPGGTGLRTMDYRISDPYLDPPAETEPDSFERVVRLPNSFWCFDPDAMEVSQGFDPVELPALKSGHITFGSLNMFCKMNDAVIDLWAKVLRRVEKSRLLILAPLGSVRERIQTRFAEAGVDPSRVELADRRDRLKYLKLYDRIDLALDTFPYNSHSTGMDSLWMGVPTITLIGNKVVGRAGLSQLSNLDLQQLAAGSEEEFVEIAARVAADVPRLAEIRRTMRLRMFNSPLCDAIGFARGIEDIFRVAWEGWCASEDCLRQVE